MILECLVRYHTNTRSAVSPCLFLMFHFSQVDELQNTIEEEQKNLAEELRAMEEHKNSLEDANGGSEAMVVD